MKDENKDEFLAQCACSTNKREASNSKCVFGGAYKQDCLKKFEACAPEIFESLISPVQYGTKVKDENTVFGVGLKKAELPEYMESGDSIVVDFGTHCVGSLSFCLSKYDFYLDAPVRFKFKFAEMPFELENDAADYKGTLCASWIQEEICLVDYEGVCRLPRRYSFRYCEITVLHTRRKVILSDFTAHAASAADYSRMSALKNVQDEELIAIDRIAAKTLAECMQQVYEDGPKRDRRLWSGDLYIQAISDMQLFKNYSLIKRCLYLFAAACEEGKYLPGCVYYYPEYYFDQDMGLADYALLFTVTLCEYYAQTKDENTAKDIFPVVKKQLDLTVEHCDENGIVTLLGGWNSFIDWAPHIQTCTGVHGVYLFALEKNIALAQALGDGEAVEKWTKALARGRKAALAQLYNRNEDAFINAYDGQQYSVHSQMWMILGGVVRGSEAQRILSKALAAQNSLKPVTPYAHHYVVEAMFHLGMKRQAVDYIKQYWGQMVKYGCDTFWEAFVPGNLQASPYNDVGTNSFCHAWSCSPAYFIRKYLEQEE